MLLSPPSSRSRRRENELVSGPQGLLSLIRSVERLDEEGEDEVPQRQQRRWDEILDTLSDLEVRLARGGIDSASATCVADDRSSPGNKRRRPTDGSKSPGAVTTGGGDDDEVASEGRLWLTALTRTLSLGDDRRGQQKGERRARDRQVVCRPCPPAAVVEAASDAITALCEHAKCHRRSGVTSADQPPARDGRKRRRRKQQQGGPTTTTIPKEDSDDELDLVADFAPRWLPSLAGHAERCLSLLEGAGEHHFGVPNDLGEPPPGVVPLTSTGDSVEGAEVAAAADCAASCLRACSSLVTLLGTGLSRAGGGGGSGGGRGSSSAPSLATRLHGLAWAAMGSYYHRLPPASSGGGRRRPPASDYSYIRWHPKVMRAGAVLASSLPLLGCADGVGGGASGDRQRGRRFAPPEELWSEKLRSCLESLDLTVRSAWWSGAFPSPPAVDATEDDANGWWLRGMRTAVTNQDNRAAAVLCRVSALTAIATSLLDMAGYPTKSFQVRLPLGRALEVCEVLMGFPAGVTSRRRDDATITAEGSLLSPRSASSIAIPIRCAGHDLFVAVAMTASSKCNALTPHARVVVGLVDRTLSSASSAAVRRSISTNTRRRRSSSSSDDDPGGDAVVRRKALRSVKVALLALGSAAAPLLGRSALLVAGCMLETIVLEDDHDGGRSRDLDRSFTVGERVELATEAIETLSAFFTVGGSFLPLPCRTTLEGVLVSCLLSIDATASSASVSVSTVAGFSPTKVALLRLATDAVCSPWNDGGTCAVALMSTLRDVASALRRDRDQAVAATAHSAICVCNALYTPRAPPLLLVGRRSGEETVGSNAASGTGIGLLDRIQTSRRESSEAVDRKASEERVIKEDDDKDSIDEEKGLNGERATQLQHPMNLSQASPKEVNAANAKSAERLATGESASMDRDDGGDTKLATACDEGPMTIETFVKPIEGDGGNEANEDAGKSGPVDSVGPDSSPGADREHQTTDPPPASPDFGVEHVTTSRGVGHLKVDATTNTPELGTTEGKKCDPKIGGSESSESGDDDFPLIVDCGPDEEDRL